ncbi:MAG: hypothetical protein LH478_14840 [Chitinophagaceae bacterium]|nr:hypothetical protein [Chitinophagaceae bacterium]
MRSYLIILFFVVCCNGCARGKYFVADIFRKGDTENLQELTLDTTYHYYLREVYRDKNQRMENVLKSNVSKNDTANKTRIEIEYLLISRMHKIVIYISTIPDIYEHYYSSNLPGDSLINAYDFNTFHFGCFDEQGESIFFRSPDGKKMLTWDIRPFVNEVYPEKLTIREIAIQKNGDLQNVVLVNRALAEPITFIHQKNGMIIFKVRPRTDAPVAIDSSLSRLMFQKLYFKQVNNGYNLYFRFDKNIANSTDSAIGFGRRKIRYSLF